MTQDVGSARVSLVARSAQDSGIGSASAVMRGKTPAEAASKFEAMFASQLVKEMRKSLGEGFFGSGPQADVYGGWLDQFLGEAIAKGGGLHIGDQVRASIERKQAAEANPLAIGAPGDADESGAPGASGALETRSPSAGSGSSSPTTGAARLVPSTKEIGS